MKQPMKNGIAFSIKSKAAFELIHDEKTGKKSIKSSWLEN